ncbi:hypothetical protein WN944_015936 [Citrus x changshan-huyou]|uniref:Uncharacterized protein n=1 Tax=Citrus x changshan-huyou TaxID=2935761 RepID=A0AAP0M8F3_9ROSI
MPKLTLDNSFRFFSQEETTSYYFHPESIETIIQNLDSDWLQKFAGEAHIQADLMGWIKMLVKISGVVDDAVEKQMTNQHVKLWLGELQNLACDVEYLFDEFQTEAFRSKLLPLDYEYSTDDEFDSLAKTKVMEIHTRLQGIASQIDSLELKERSLGMSGKDYPLSLCSEVPVSYGKMIAIKNIDLPPMAATELLKAHVTRPYCNLLVYEFMKNASLQDILYDVSQGRRELDWLARHRIARGIACGLEYLHLYHMLVAGPNKDRVQELKAQLAREFEMKDLEPANKILGMQIHRDRNNRKIWLSQKNYLKKILRHFNMHDCKPIFIPLPVNFKLSSIMCPNNEAERNKMAQVPYASAVGSLMFIMICSTLDMAQAVGAVNRYMANSGGKH